MPININIKAPINFEVHVEIKCVIQLPIIMEILVNKSDIENNTTLLIKGILVFLIPYVIPIPIESMLSEIARNR